MAVGTEPIAELAAHLHRLDGRGYKAYKGIAGGYVKAGLSLLIDHVQGDPFAEPSRLRASLTPDAANLPSWALTTAPRRISVADFLHRKLWRLLGAQDLRCGSGQSGAVVVAEPGQEVLARSAMLVRQDGTVEARFRVGLPAAGRRILGRAAARLVCDQLPRLLRQALVHDASDDPSLRLHLETVEDAQALRDELSGHGLVAFVADGACLPRRTGVDQRPLAKGVTHFETPAELRATLPVPNAGQITGMGLPAGVTLIVGGGYHGKSTLLRALERGVYDHIPGDGREWVVATPEAVKIRAEDGRRVAGVDISAFINNLPGGADTSAFYSDNASGSTSQAAAIAEALEVGARCLLVDEDTSATNFMIRDARMQRLVASVHEPITPFIDRVRALYDTAGVSTVLVLGGSGDYFDVADTVLTMREFLPAWMTERAKDIAEELPASRVDEPPALEPQRVRVPRPQSLDASRGKRAISIKVREKTRVEFGRHQVDLSAVEQLVEITQTRAIAEALVWAKDRFIDGERPVAEALGQIIAALDGGEGLDRLAQPPRGDFASFRVFELAAFLNRMRGLRVRPVEDR